jgi:integrase
MLKHRAGFRRAYFLLIRRYAVPNVKLTIKGVAGIAAPDPSGKQVIHWDTDLRGFGVLASGTTTAKTYIVQRRLPDGKTRRVTVGAVGEFEKVEDARRNAGRVLLELREGRDPKAEKRTTAARARTLRQWLEVYLTARKDLRPSSIGSYRGMVARHLGDWLDRPLRDLTADMIEDRHVVVGKSTGPAAANLTMRTLRAIWNFAEDRDSTLPINPARRLKRAWFETPVRTRMVKSDDLQAFYRAVDELPSRTARDYILTLLFTGLRRREAGALTWGEIDFAARMIRLPAIRAKARRKLDLPMSDFVRDLLVARRALGVDGPFVFASNSKSGYLEEPKFPLGQVAEKSGILVSSHDLRRTYITVAEETEGLSPMALKALVNHALGSDVTEGYVQMTTERLRKPAQLVCDRLKELCGIAAPVGVSQMGERA